MGIKSACMTPRGGFWAHLTCVEISWAHLAQGSPGGDLVGSGGLTWHSGLPEEGWNRLVSLKWLLPAIPRV